MYEIFQGFQNSLCFYSSLKTEAVLFFFIHIYNYIYLYIYEKVSPKWKKFHEQNVFCFRFYILCENFSQIGQIIKKIPKFQSDPLKVLDLTIRDAKKHVFFKPCFLYKKEKCFFHKKQFFIVFFCFFQLQEDF